jgi:hypothetical protein
MSRLGGHRRVAWYRTLATLLAILGWATEAHARPRSASDSELAGVGFVVIVFPFYVFLMVVAFFRRSSRKSVSGRTASRSIRTCANLLPITVLVFVIILIYLVNPMDSGHHPSTLETYLVWGCLLSPFPLALILTYPVSRLPRLYRVTSSPWWMLLYGAVTAALWLKLSS